MLAATKGSLRDRRESDAETQYRYGLQHESSALYVAAINYFEQAADGGHAGAQFHLGRIYALGKGVPQNDLIAGSYYEQAAVQGHAGAQNELGYLYLRGQGIEQSDTQAVYWFQTASERGDTNAHDSLAFMYQEGIGIEADPVRALSLYQASLSEMDHPETQLNLAVCYDRQAEQGIVGADPLAEECYQKADQQRELLKNCCGFWKDTINSKASNQTRAALHFRLGMVAWKGLGGVPANIVEAKTWFLQARDLGYPHAQSALDRLEERTPSPLSWLFRTPQDLEPPRIDVAGPSTQQKNADASKKP